VKSHKILHDALPMVASRAWCGSIVKSLNYSSLVWMRLVKSVALGSFESPVNDFISDLYLVHERGLQIEFTDACPCGSALLTPICCKHIQSNDD